MLYRWGFIENGVFTECKPIVDDDAAIDFAPQTNDVFYRAKLNGGLSFRFEFDDILAKGYNYEHIVVLQYFNQDLNDWGEVWRGRFALTDCEIDYDTHTISVQPETQDRYTKILDALETEYNLVKLAVPAQPVTINVRPCLQLYCSGDDKITNYVGESFWEASCNTITDPTELTNTYHFAKVGELFAVGFTIKETWFGETTYTKIIAYTNNTERDENHNIYLTGNNGVTYKCSVWINGNERHYTLWDSNNNWLFEAYYDGYAFDHIYENPNLAYEINAYSQWSVIQARILLQTELATISLLDTTLTTYDIPTNDMSGSVNLNYNKIAPCTTACIHFVSSVTVQDNPTEYGISYADKYFVRYLETGYNPMPVAPAQWFLCSLWVYPYYRYRNYIDSYSAERTIRDAYLLSNTCIRLLQKAGWTGQYLISRAFGGYNDYVGDPFIPLITPKSNVISSYYDTPAQKAPITLQKVLNMLKDVYKAYWYIDSNNNFHIEHISYYDNGYSYSDDEPDLLVDLENRQHTNTKENKVFGQNRIKYDKQDMPQQFAFGWMDDQTLPFYGYPIKCLDNYVQKGVKEELTIGFFDTDVDYILGSPDEVSKDGFVLFTCPTAGGVVDWKLAIENVAAKDDDGITINYRIQNPDGAFIKLHQSWWRYQLPCENINVNNQDTTAITTGRYKLQNVEFADEIMAEILADIDNCNKVIRTQQGDGKIKSLSINLNSLKAKGDLLFNFVGRWYYLRGTALGASIIINVDNEPITIEVSDNKWRLKYAEPMTALDFNGADVVSVDFADCDRLENLTTADGMFENCAELLAVDFGGKKLAAVTSAVDMFAGCAQLTTLICPQSSTWKPDLTFADCPDLTTESVYSLIGFLYDYDAGVHTIDLNSTMWNALDADTQTDITTKAAAKGWTIGTAVAYYISGQSAAGTVYATINGASVEIPVSGGAFNYAYYAPITSLSFENDGDVTDIDFSLSDGLAGVTSLANAFKNCAGLTTLDFTNCDLSNVTTASDCFAGCVSLYTLEIPTGTWKPDVDLSDTVILYSEMLNVVDGLYTYTGGVHNVTFNSTIWDAMSIAQQQAVFDAAGLKYWTTNSVAVVYVVSGTSSNINGTETFNIQYILDDQIVPSAVETVTVTVDGSGNWSFSYTGKKIYGLTSFAASNTNILTVDFSGADDFSRFVISGTGTGTGIFSGCTNLLSVSFANQLFSACTEFGYNFYNCTKLVTIDLSAATFALTQNFNRNFESCTKLETLNMPSATWASVIRVYRTFQSCSKLATLNVPENSTAIVPTSTPSDAPMDLHFSPLNYASMLKVANWLCDLTGQSAHTCTFKSTAWALLSTAEQNTIDGILSGKNWTRAIA